MLPSLAFDALMDPVAKPDAFVLNAVPSNRPLTHADLTRYIDRLFKPRPHRQETDAATYKLLHELGIPYFVENGLALISATSMRKIDAHMKHATP